MRTVFFHPGTRRKWTSFPCFWLFIYLCGGFAHPCGVDYLSILYLFCSQVWCQNYEKLGHLCGCTVGCILWALVLIPYHLQTWCWFVIRELDLLFPFWSTDENGLKGERSGLPFIFAVIWFIGILWLICLPLVLLERVIRFLVSLLKII